MPGENRGKPDVKNSPLLKPFDPQMKLNIRSGLPFLVALTLLSGCASLSTQVAVEERSTPETYGNEIPGDNAASFTWQAYFDDTLLNTLIDTALARNLDLMVTLQRIEVARAGVKFAKGQIFPEVQLNASGGMRRFGLYTMDGAGNISTEILPGKVVPIDLPDLYTGVLASWEADIWGKLRNRKRAALSRYLASVEGAHFVVTSLIADVAISYYELIALDNELDIIRRTILSQQEALDVILLQKEAGRANELGVQQFRAQLLNTQALERQAMQAVVETENQINFLLARYPQPIERRQEVLFEDLPEQIASGLPSDLLENRPDVRRAKLEVEASRYDLRAAKYSFYPSLHINAAAGFQAFRPDLLFLSPQSIAYTATGSLLSPLVNMAALKAQFNTAKADQISALYQYQERVINGYMEVANELANLENLNAMEVYKQEESEVLTQSIETSIDLYRSARATYIEVLLAQQNALRANLDLVEVNRQQRFASVQLYKALGGGWR